MSGILSLEDIASLEKHIDTLFDYKPIPEHEVKALCEKVRPTPNSQRPKKSCKPKATCNLSKARSPYAEISTASSTI